MANTWEKLLDRACPDAQQYRWIKQHCKELRKAVGYLSWEVEIGLSPENAYEEIMDVLNKTPEDYDHDMEV